jgi:hypothetical protein
MALGCNVKAGDTIHIGDVEVRVVERERRRVQLEIRAAAGVPIILTRDGEPRLGRHHVSPSQPVDPPDID